MTGSRLSEAWVRRTLRRWRAAPASEIADGDFAKVVGPARPLADVVTSPMSGRPSIYYRVVVEVEHGGWLPLLEHTDGVDFSVGGRAEGVVVSPGGARTSLMRQVDSLQNPRAANWDFVRQLLEGLGLPFWGWRSLVALDYWDGTAVRRLRATEGIIEAGETVAAAGVCIREIDSDSARVSNYRTMPTVRVLRPHRQVPLLLSDRPDTLS